MKVQCHNDERRGHARFICTDLAEPPSGISFSLCRASDQTFLGKSGWQSAEEHLMPDSHVWESGALALSVGPVVTDSLDENENYRLTLFADRLPPQMAAFSIAGVNRSLRKSQSLVQGVAPEPEPTEMERQSEDSQNNARKDVGEDTREEPLTMSQPKTSSGGFSAAFAVIFVLLLLLGGGFWWHARQKAEADSRNTAQQSIETANAPKGAPDNAAEAAQAESVASGPNGASSEARRTANEPPQGSSALTPRERVREFMRDERASAQGAMTLYHDLSGLPDGGSPETRDAVYRLLYFASQQGDAEATFALARCVDPATPAFGTIPKNAPEAWTYYTAVVKEKPEAADSMRDLKIWLENAAGKGEAQARQWIEAIVRDNAKP
ncbi:MAG: hypothetical protein LBC94_08865 [Desulfovibrio sp.]|jgi:hypothetical protein|nr:hypothetical protein [Desulfovibrio sp.]